MPQRIPYAVANYEKMVKENFSGQRFSSFAGGISPLRFGSLSR